LARKHCCLVAQNTKSIYPLFSLIDFPGFYNKYNVTTITGMSDCRC
jgi:hypothetical protein